MSYERKVTSLEDELVDDGGQVFLQSRGFRHLTVEEEVGGGGRGGEGRGLR